MKVATSDKSMFSFYLVKCTHEQEEHYPCLMYVRFLHILMMQWGILNMFTNLEANKHFHLHILCGFLPEADESNN